MKTFFFFFLESTCALCPWSLALASSIPVLGLESVCPRKGFPWPWPWPRIFFVSLALALASRLVSSTPPLVTILQAYMSLTRHIRKGVLIRRNIASHLFTAVGCQQFRKESRKHRRKTMFERNCFFFHHCLLSCRCVMIQKQYFE